MANKRVIDLATLSETVQEGQYVLVDSSGGTGKMDLKHIVDEAGSFDPSGEYPELFAGNLTTDKAQEDKTPYLFRKTGGTLSRVGERCYDTIIGASVVGNQLVQSGATSVTVQSGHKYYAKIDGTESLGTSTGSAITINDSAKDMVIDLSLYLPANIVDYIYQLESATAGAGIAKLRSWGFLRGYQAYNAGSIESVEVTGKKVVGFNQWDEEWEVGDLSNSGQPITASDRIRTKNFIHVIPSTTYYFKAGVSGQTSWQLFGCFYDEDKNFISTFYKRNNSLTVPSNCHYIKWTTTGGYGTTYNHDICINLSSDRNGEYEPYTEQTYDYGDDTLNGVFKLDSNNELYADGDVKTSDGVIARRYELLDLGTLNWTYDSNSSIFSAYVSGIKSGTYTDSNFVCSKYPTMPMSYSQFTYGIRYNSPTSIGIKDSAYTDAVSFKTAMNGVMLVYPLATETTEQGDPFPSPQVCYPDGTEEYVTSNGVPVGHETEYPYDLKGLVEGLIDVPDVPSANGTYVLKATRSASGVAYNWVTG